MALICLWSACIHPSRVAGLCFGRSVRSHYSLSWHLEHYLFMSDTVFLLSSSASRLMRQLIGSDLRQSARASPVCSEGRRNNYPTARPLWGLARDRTEAEATNGDSEGEEKRWTTIMYTETYYRYTTKCARDRSLVACWVKTPLRQSNPSELLLPPARRVSFLLYRRGSFYLVKNETSCFDVFNGRMYYLKTCSCYYLWYSSYKQSAPSGLCAKAKAN